MAAACTAYDKLQNRVDAFSDAQGKHSDAGTFLEELGLDFQGLRLDGLNLAGAMIPGSNFSGMILNDVDFYGANLGGSDFSGATLINADFTKANLDHTNFTDAKIIGGSWFRATCVDAYMEGLEFSGTNLDRVFPELK